MGELSESIKSIPALLKEIKEKFMPPAATFKQAKLKDGTVIAYQGDTPQAGQKLMVITPEGEMPAPTGEHMMEDGTMLVVENGVIMDVKGSTPPAEQPKTPEEQAQQNPNTTPVMEEAQAKKIIERIEKESVFATQIKELSEKFDAQAKEISALKQENADLKASLKKADEFAQATFKAVEEIGNTASVSSRQKASEAFKKEGRKTVAQIIDEQLKHKS